MLNEFDKEQIRLIKEHIVTCSDEQFINFMTNNACAFTIANMLKFLSKDGLISVLRELKSNVPPAFWPKDEDVAGEDRDAGDAEAAKNVAKDGV